MIIPSRGISALHRSNRFRAALVVGVAAASLFLVPYFAKPARASHQENAPPAASPAPQDPGAQAYAQRCAICHGDQRQGDLPGFPPLLGITHRMTDDKIVEMIHTGKGRMPGFPEVKDGELTALVHFLTTAPEQPAPGTSHDTALTGLSAAGEALFQQNCSFCHGRDAQGGETGPDLTESRLVRRDRTGDEIAKVIHEGRPDNKMPAFNFNPQETRSIIAFIRMREAEAVARPGGRRGVSVADLQTGNAEAGKRYFDGAGGCTKCHSASGDLAGIASRYEGLELEERMLYPADAKSRVTVTLASGEKVSGVLAYRDEFTVALRDAHGVYHSWRADRVHFTVDAPVEGHVDLFSKYSDADIHNLMAYMQTLR